MSRKNQQRAAKQSETPLEQARANPAVRAGLLRSIAARLRGEKPVSATELTHGEKVQQHRAGG